MGQVFVGLENISGKLFALPFIWKIKTLPKIVGDLSTFPLKKSGLGLQNTVTLEKEKYNSLLRARCELVGAVMVDWGF